MNNTLKEESWIIAASDIDLDVHLNGIEAYSLLSEENLTTILRSFTETLQQKRLHLNLLGKIECDDKDILVQQL